jgi:hypothetical protein
VNLLGSASEQYWHLRVKGFAAIVTMDAPATAMPT